MIIGNGGREHALAWKLAQSNKIDKIYCVPGNGGTANEKKCINIKIENIDEIATFAKENNVYLTIVGPEKYLIEGIADKFENLGLNIIGPNKKASMLEGSKEFSRNFCKKYNIQSPNYSVFNNYNSALNYIKNAKFPIVIKADGIASGKGVVIAYNFSDAKKCIYDFMIKDIFSGSGKKIIIEEFLEGYEMSIFLLFDGINYKFFQSAKDHKKINEGEKGLNTGGMGAISPHPKLDNELMKKIEEKIILPTINGIKSEQLNYKGVIFLGLMIKNNEPYLLEYNVRFGDPETQAMMPLLKSDLFDILNNIINKNLNKTEIIWDNKISCCVVLASKGYPLKYDTGYNIKFDINNTATIFHSGTIYKNGKIVTNGGRVISVVGTNINLENARKNVYSSIQNIYFENMYYRKDI
nr:phosphoribosylamine--glycine ligase [Marinitoga sp. 38H-ov]